MKAAKSAPKKPKKSKKTQKKDPAKKPKAAPDKPWSDDTFAGFGVPRQGGWGPD